MLKKLPDLPPGYYRESREYDYYERPVSDPATGEYIEREITDFPDPLGPGKSIRVYQVRRRPDGSRYVIQAG